LNPEKKSQRPGNLTIFTIHCDPQCFIIMIYFRAVTMIDAILAQPTRIDMPRIDEGDAAAARAIFQRVQRN
jgi:hypothetical protein